jgi:murein L,D-transpeptidase YcbB/YkuD
MVWKTRRTWKRPNDRNRDRWIALSWIDRASRRVTFFRFPDLDSNPVSGAHDMNSSGWSSLLLGTILATVATVPALAQQAGGAATAVVATADSVTPPRATPDMIIDPAAAIAAILDAARPGNAIADETVDRIMTGSIFAVGPGPRTGGLTEIRAPQGGGLGEPKTAPEPKRQAAVTSTEAAAAASQPKPVAADPAPVKPADTTTTPAEATAEPAKPAPEAPKPADAVTAPVPETPKPAETVAAPAPETPKPNDAAEATPAPEAAKPAAAADVPAPEAPKAAEAVPSPEAAKPAEAAAVPAPEAAKPTEAAVAPVAAEAAKPAVASAPAATETAPTPAPAGASYSTASEPVAAKPVDAAPTSVPEKTGSVEASAPVQAPAQTPVAAAAPVAAPAPSPAPASPAPLFSLPIPATAPYATPDAAIAATIATEQAAAALKAALEERQPRAGSTEERADRAALLDFYADRAFLPLFVDARGTTDQARAAMTVIARADRDGLDPKDYAFAPITSGMAPEARAKAEIDVALDVVRLARHLQSGSFDPHRVHDLVTPKPPVTEAREVLERIAGSRDVVATLDAYAPPHEGYRRLKAMLAELRGAKEEPMVMVPAGPLLKPGQKDARVALLRERLGVADVVSDAEVYDPALAEAVKTFQRERGIAANGKVGRETLSALNDEKSGTAARVAEVISNMERWRWLPRDLGELHVIVNVADFHLDVMKDGQSIHHARVIVGKPSNPTPIFSEAMRYVVVNPYWNVPYSIVKKEMIGKAQSTAGGALASGAWEVEVGRHRVDPTTVDWSTVDASKVTIRQRPGGGNALGNIKFLFPNQHAVYLHDTSSRGLFSRDYRALSHGCVRVHEPFSFADAVLSEEPDKLDGARLKKMVGGGEKTISLKQTIPVHITYFTAWVDDGGQLQTRPDLYGHDGRVKRLLGL